MKLRIKEVCKRKSISQQELSKKLGITYQALHSRINGNPSIKRLQEIATALDCEVAEFLPVNPPFYHSYDSEGNWKGVRIE